MADKKRGPEKTMADKAYDAIYGKGGALDKLKNGEKIKFKDAVVGAVALDYAFKQLPKKKR